MKYIPFMCHYGDAHVPVVTHYIFGYHIWLQSDAAFFYPRLDQYSLSVGMFCSTCDLSRRPLRSPSDSEQFSGECVLTRRAGPRGKSVLGKSLMGQDLSQIYERYH